MKKEEEKVPFVHIQPNLEADGLETAFSAQVVSFLKAHILNRLSSLANTNVLINADVTHMNSEMGEYLASTMDG